MDNFNSRQYYIDQTFIVADSPRLECPVLYCRYEDSWLLNNFDEMVKKVLKTCRMKSVNGEFETYEGGRFLRLKPID